MTVTACSASGTRRPPPWGACGSRRNRPRRLSWPRFWPRTWANIPIVFCGYGEPTCRADDLFWLCDQLRAAGRADLPPIRLNTNGHGSLINHRDITPELKGRLDAVSVSLNGSNREEYLRLTRPGAGEKGWQAMLDFVRQAVQYVPKVMVSIVDYDKSPQEMEACRRLRANLRLAEELGATFRVRPFAG